MSLKIAKVLFVVTLLHFGCGDKTTNGNNPPSLVLMSLDKTSMNQSEVPSDSIVATLSFQDIDGDITGGPQTPSNIFIVDNRDGTEDPVTFPLLPDLDNGQKGDMTLVIYTTCCIVGEIRGCIPNTEDNVYSYDIYIVDAAGNESNRVSTGDITLLCR